MKVFLVLAAIVAVGSASSYHNSEAGSSNQYRNEDNAGGSQFGYDEQHTSGGSFRREARDAHGSTSGSYGLTDADGRQRIVHYIADAAGFRAQVQTNEPGVEASNPADVAINKAAATVVVAPAPINLAPLAPLAPLPAPVQFSAPIGIKSYSYSSSPLRATFGPAPVDSYAVKQVAPLPAPLPVPQFSAHLAAPLPAPLAAPVPAPFRFPAASPIYHQHIEQAPLLAPEPVTPRGFSYAFSSNHLSPVAVKAPTFARQANYVKQQTQVPIYNQHIEQAPLLAPETATSRGFSYAFASNHLSPVAVKAPALIQQANYVQQQTQDY